MNIEGDRKLSNALSTTDTMPVRLELTTGVIVGDPGVDSCVTKTRWELAVGLSAGRRVRQGEDAILARSLLIVYERRLDGTTE